MSAESHDEKEHDKGGHGGGGGGGHGPGGGHEEHHEGCPEWLISYADNVTLMMGFFVILLAMNMKPDSAGGSGTSKDPGHPEPTAEMLDFAIAVREAFNNPVDPASASPIDLPLIRRLIERSGESQAEQVGQIGREHDVRSIRKSMYFSPAGSVPFETGSSAMDEKGVDALRQMYKVLKGHNLVIQIRGHVSAAEAFPRPDRGVRFSYERATAVADALVAEGIPWSQLRIIACGDGERITPKAYDKSAHATNQRVEVIVTDETADLDAEH